jgi:D-glycerate 3-kinase
MPAPVVRKSIEFLVPILDSWNFDQKALVVSVSGPQGSGKSFLSEKLVAYLQQSRRHLKSITISTDDLYLKHKDQLNLTAEFPDNPLLTGRGLPGTHDVEMAFNLLTKLTNKEKGFIVPKYDKSAFDGAGDRAPQDQWLKIDEPVDIVILEGWFNGFTPIADGREIESLREKSALLRQYDLESIFYINSVLDTYIKIWGFVNVDIFFDTDNIQNVYTWRVEQEHELIAKKGSGMTDEQVRSFVDRYMVVYELYFKDFVHFGVPALPAGRHLRLKLNLERDIEESEIF